MALRAITRGPRFHFFGYYDKTPWDASGRFLLALETGFMDRRPGPDDEAVVGMVDREDGDRFHALAATRAWNWQQGCMLQWVPGSNNEIIFNDRENDQFVAVVLNVRTGARRTLPRPVYALNPNGRDAVSLNFSRLFDVRPGYGYAGVPDPQGETICPDNDGAYHVDLQTGETRLILSLAQAAAMGKPQIGMDTGKHRFNHAQWAPAGDRFALLHRWSVGRDQSTFRAPWRTRLLTLNRDGSDPFLLSDHEMVSHYDWQDEKHLLAWAHRPGAGNRYYRFADKTDQTEVVGEGVLTVDGHCSFAPHDRHVFLTDTYPDKEGFRTLLTFEMASSARTELGRFLGPTPSDGEIRCDLHPRWSRDGKQVCIDSIHEEGARQMYVLDVPPSR